MIPGMFTLVYCSQQVTFCSLRGPLYVYTAPRFYLLRALATLKITNCLETPYFFCFMSCLLLFFGLIIPASLGPSAYYLFLSIYSHCLLTKACQLQIFYWLVQITSYSNSSCQSSSERLHSYFEHCHLHMCYCLTLTPTPFGWHQIAPNT